MTGSPTTESASITSRRRFVRTATGLVLATAGIGPRYTTRAQDDLVQLRLALASSAVPGANDFTLQLAQSWGDQNAAIIDIAFTELVDLPPRSDRIIRGGEQRDIVELQDLQPFRHGSNLVDLTSVADAVVAEQGPYLPWVEQTVRVSGIWTSLPIGGTTTAVTYRPSALQAAGFSAFPADWSGFFELATTLKATGLPSAGQALAQTPLAAPSFCYYYMWSHGANEVNPNSRLVSFDSPELSEALTTFGSAWSSGFDPGGTVWDDRASLDAFINGQISITIGGPELYLALRSIGDADVAIAPIPIGPAGQFIPLGSRSLGIPTRSPNIELATNFLTWWTTQARYSQWIVAQRGATLPANEPLLKLPTFEQDANLKPFVDALSLGRVKGFSAAPSKASAEVSANYFVVNTFSDVAKGVDVATALDRGQRLMEHFYTQNR